MILFTSLVRAVSLKCTSVPCIRNEHLVFALLFTTFAKSSMCGSFIVFPISSLSAESVECLVIKISSSCSCGSHTHVAEALHLLQHLVDLGHDVTAAHLDGRVGAVPQGNVEHGTVLDMSREDGYCRTWFKSWVYSTTHL